MGFHLSLEENKTFITISFHGFLYCYNRSKFADPNLNPNLEKNVISSLQMSLLRVKFDVILNQVSPWYDNVWFAVYLRCFNGSNIKW